MKTSTSLTRCVVVLMLAFAADVNADVIVVDASGGGAFTDIWDAIEAAADGDTVLVKSGTYAPTSPFGDTVTISQSLVLIAEAGASVTVQTGAATVEMRIQDLPAGSAVVVRGIDFEFITIEVRDNAGHVRFEDCSFEGRRGYQMGSPPFEGVPGDPGALVENSASVVFQDCDLQGGRGKDADGGTFYELPSAGGPGLVASGSDVVVSGTTVTGGIAGENSGTSVDGGHGLEVTDSSVLLSGTTVTGGLQAFSPGFCFWTPGSGLVVMDSASVVRIRDSSFAAGAGPSTSCVGLDLDAPLGTTLNLPASARGFTIDSPVRENSFATLTATGASGDHVFVFSSLSAGYLEAWPSQGVFLLGAPYQGPVALGSIGSGPLTVPVLVRDLPAGVEAATIHVQAFFLNGSELVLGPATSPTVIDDTL